MDRYTKMRKFYELALHHKTFNEECLHESVFPIGIRALATCATLGADDDLRSKYVKILTNASIELTIANVQHLHNLATQTSTTLTQIEKHLDAQRDNAIASQWQTTQTSALKEMSKMHDDLKEKRKKK